MIMARRRKAKSRRRKHTNAGSRKKTKQAALLARNALTKVSSAPLHQAQETTAKAVGHFGKKIDTNVERAQQAVDQSRRNAEIFMEASSIVPDIYSFSRQLLELTQEQMNRSHRTTQRLLDARSPQEWSAALLRNTLESSMHSAHRLSEMSFQLVLDATRRVSAVHSSTNSRDE
jgi:hypothetical protein